MKNRYAVQVKYEYEFDILIRYAEKHPASKKFLPRWDKIKECTSAEGGICMYFANGIYDSFDLTNDIYKDGSFSTCLISAKDFIKDYCEEFSSQHIGQYWLDDINEVWYICGKGSDGKLILEYEQKTEYDHRYFSYLEQDGTINLVKQVDGYDHVEPSSTKVLSGTSLVDDYDNLLGEDDEA